jgi:hypothetical protein
MVSLDDYLATEGLASLSLTNVLLEVRGKIGDIILLLGLPLLGARTLVGLVNKTIPDTVGTGLLNRLGHAGDGLMNGKGIRGQIIETETWKKSANVRSKVSSPKLLSAVLYCFVKSLVSSTIVIRMVGKCQKNFPSFCCGAL